MALVNENFLKLENNYLFADIAKKVNVFKVTHPNVDVISLGIGDVTRPLCPAVIEAMHRATDEMASDIIKKGWLRRVILFCMILVILLTLREQCNKVC